MEQYEVDFFGRVNKGFQGHISYNFVIPKEINHILVSFSFNKRNAEQDIEALHQHCRSTLAQQMPNATFTEEELQFFYRMPKSEINVSVFHNGKCLGSCHKDLLKKEISISALEASEGFYPYVFHGGVIEIILHVQNVLNDETDYTLTMKGACE